MDNFITPNNQAVPGGFWRRWVAMTIDAFLLAILQFPLSLAVSAASHLLQGVAGDQLPLILIALNVLSFVVSILTTFFYYGWFYHNKGATLGKMVLGLRVVNDETGTNLTYKQAFLRETIGKLISGLPLTLGFIWAAFRPDKKAFHDLIFKTQVLRKS